MVFYLFCKCGVNRLLGLLILGVGAGLSLECSPLKVYKHRSWSKHRSPAKVRGTYRAQSQNLKG